MKKQFLFILTVLCIDNLTHGLEQTNDIYIYTNNSKHAETVKKALSKCNVAYKLIPSVSANDTNLFVIFDLDSLDETQLPAYYIAYQTRNLSQKPIDAAYLKKLSKAVAVWDYSSENIQHYSPSIYHYHYFPDNYQYSDAIILPCLLPVDALKGYKELLDYSNRDNTDISSHLPTMFYYSVKSKPSLVMDVGVRGGESTLALHKACDLFDAKLIGIDIDPASAPAYAHITNATFLCMNDIGFQNYYYKSANKNEKADIVFIDTSHEYNHTMQEINEFLPLLKENGLFMFHDSNVTPLNNNTTYIRLNETYGHAHGNPRGVTHAIKNYFSISFDEFQYQNFAFSKDNQNWQLIHYPYCNGLTVIIKQH